MLRRGGWAFVLADVLGRTGDAAAEFADYADGARIAGQQCEHDCDALTKNGDRENFSHNKKGSIAPSSIFNIE
ncbi:DUF2514 family protein [Burkholderia mayonis]|uniref:DUF2514 family protein n=1 Tax=Burkholderia mayonis TaxID=1385591 RepID=UPI0009EA1C8A